MKPVVAFKAQQDYIEVYKDKICISPKGIMGNINKGAKGTKTIPYASITAIQYKEPGFTSGYMQFSLGGGNEGKFGVLEATKDENSFLFGPKHLETVRKVKKYIEQQMEKTKQTQHSPAQQTPSGVSIADELIKLAELRDQGILTEEEFQAAKMKLIQ